MYVICNFLLYFNLKNTNVINVPSFCFVKGRFKFIMGILCIRENYLRKEFYTP